MSRTDADLAPLVRPGAVAIIGASADPTRIGGRPIAYMLRAGFQGAILPVNPNRAEVQGLPCYPSVAALPLVPDVAVVAVPGAAALQAVEELGARGTRFAVMFTAGYAEVGEVGAQAALVAAARRHGMRLLGPNCLGLFNAASGFYPIFTASLEGGLPLPGRIGIASQSGAYGTHLFAACRARGIGTGMLITTGNEADLAVADAIGWMTRDDDLDVIMAYVEGVQDGPAFAGALAAARRAKKPVILMKVGRSAVGSAAAQSHTASIAGNDAIFSAVLAEHGAIRARSTEELIDIAYAATRRIYPVPNTLGVITISGGAGVLISDAAEAAGLPMPPMPEDAQARLKAILPIASPLNPVDCTAQAFNDLSLIGRFTESMIADGGYSSILAFFTQIGGAPSMAPAIRTQLNAVKARHPDRLYALSVLAPEERNREYEADGYLLYEDPARAVVALDAMGRLGTSFSESEPAVPPVGEPVRLPEATPSEAEAKRLLAAYGIATVPEAVCADAEAAVAAAESFGFPVVMKILSPDILHKTEIGGVLLDVADAEAVRRGHATLLARGARHAPAARIEGVLVARQIKGAVECIMGIQRDPVFGPVAMVGLGGVFVEVMRDVVFRRCPFGEDVAEAMIRSIKAAPLLTGARGRPPCDIAALARMLSRLSVFAAAAGPRLASIDLNPVFALPEGAFAADAVIEVGEAG
ncbi:Acyl-CoA synthetase (NDP forming) [Methylobacterium sp. 174MFSha1.1]|uniref:acetate--CoA ligase family protein n=1 Tax=Methylobacterium sp. 174MFSha1.1 TaxID=1502749 RepID=UPI0008E04AB0|nr:acetate--CoA ligase family protein [Methylobacterium sp. 174MFSha1.1]SFU90125.1 Acyl-CoA synthetase (NDP forming) [Methylobacterium sp. 174MFSha1.1]